MTQRVQRFQCLSPSDMFTLLCPLVPHYTSREGDALFLVCFLTYLSRKTTSLTFSLLISIPNRCVWHLCSVVRGTFCLIVSRLQVPKWIHVFISWFLHLFAKMYFCVGVDVGQNCHKLKSSEKLISDLWECLLTLTWTRLLDARPFPVMFLSLFHQSCFKRLLMKKKRIACTMRRCCYFWLQVLECWCLGNALQKYNSTFCTDLALFIGTIQIVAFV